MGDGERLSMEEFEYDTQLGEVVVVNQSGLPDDEVISAVRAQAKLPEVAALSRWVSSNAAFKNSKTRTGTIFDRDRFVTPENIFDKFRTASDAARTDDVVAGICETTEQLAFKRVVVECENDQQQNIWNQIAEDIDVTQRMREIWRELFILNQCYPAILWKRKSYRVRGRTPTGTKSKKEFKNLTVPRGITLLDPCKVVPFGDFMFGNEKLLYLASPGEASAFDEFLANKNSSDLVVQSLIKNRVDLGRDERQLVQDITGMSAHELNTFELNPDNVWRITSTRPDYQRFADVRMESVFELLDLKHLLRAMDRTSLLGSTNAVILVKKGSDERPAQPGELETLSTQIGGTARQPIIVSDHRIEIEIITPKTDKTLSPERYNGTDSRITSRLYQILSSGSYSSGMAADNSLKLFQVISTSMEARRDSIRDSIMRHVFEKTMERNPELVDDPKLQFYPRRVALAFDPNIATFMMDLRDGGDLSRDTMLAELDILESDEAIKMERENKYYNNIFGHYNAATDPNPGSEPDGLPQGDGENGIPPRDGRPVSKRVAGRRGGGNKNGGGMNRQSQRSGPPRGEDKPE